MLRNQMAVNNPIVPIPRSTGRAGSSNRSRPNTSAEQIIHDQLEILGNIVYNEARRNSRVSRSYVTSTGRTHVGGTLRDSINYMVRGTTLTVGQVYYGKYQRPDELQMAINRNLPTATQVIVSEITQWLGLP